MTLATLVLAALFLLLLAGLIWIALKATGMRRDKQPRAENRRGDGDGTGGSPGS